MLSEEELPPRKRRPPLTWLYVPADRPDRVLKAMASSADVVIVDLEDAVAVRSKDRARDAAATALEGRDQGPVDGRPPVARQLPVQVRVNHPRSSWGSQDLAMVRGLPEWVGVRLPKCESPDEVVEVAHLVGPRPLHLLVESALGVERAFALAGSHPRVASIGLGEADLRADLGVTGDEGLLWSRGRLVSASVAAGLGPPSMSVHPDIRDVAGLLASCRVGRALGFLGRTAIHPDQLDPIREAFAPTAPELARAREMLAAAAAGAARGVGALVLADGRFVDEAVVRQARRVVALVDDPADG
ncbi:CoA ester lyase [Lapillicoccus sp.]|uniref:HpcH/HpaI aldolase/citrate lyase family protein n=1 Tax=Lapillicoccus sp. TaxID=1909287 RepID=UPI0025FC345A|nr:CoA ester lyase [Lapillicoccus sp.]